MISPFTFDPSRYRMPFGLIIFVWTTNLESIKREGEQEKNVKVLLNIITAINNKSCARFNLTERIARSDPYIRRVISLSSLSKTADWLRRVQNFEKIES